VNGKEATPDPATVMNAHDSFAIIVAPVGQTITPPGNYTFPAGE